MNILITGGAGFIGSHLADRLLQSGHKVICVDNLSTGDMKNLEHARDFGSNMQFIKADANSYEELENIFKYQNINAVYHFAAVVGVKRTLEYPFLVLEDIDGIKNILDLSLKYKVKKLIYASSSEIYGQSPILPMSEGNYINPILPYAAVKLIGERYCMAYFEKHNIGICCLRLFNVYGPRQNATSYGFVTAILIRKAIENKDIIIYGNGSQTRDFTYIDDVINCSQRALYTDACNGEILNIGTGVRTSILSLAEAIIKLTGSSSKIKYLPQRANDILDRCAEIKKMTSILDCTPQFDMQEGLKSSLEWYKSNALMSD